MKPFVHTFTTEDAFYVYDVNLNQVVQVDECIHGLIDIYDGINCKETANILTGRFPADRIEASLSHVDEFRRKLGLFSSSRPRNMKYPFTLEEMARDLESHMTQLVLNVTESCNLRCTYCVYSGAYAHERRHNEKKMSPAVARSAVDFFMSHSSESSKRSISFYGGEPLLNLPLIKETIDYARSKGETGMAFQITTNGTLLTPRVSEYLARNEVSILVSLDGPRDIHDGRRKFQGRKGTHAAITANLEKMLRDYPDYFGKHVGFSCTVAEPVELEKIYDYFASTDPFAKMAQVVNFVRSFDPPGVMDEAERGDGHGDDLGEMPARFTGMLLAGDDSALTSPAFTFLTTLVGKSFLRVHQRSTTPLEAEIYPNGICTPGKKRLFVSPAGTFHPCEKIDYHFKIGDLQEGFDHDAIYGLIGDYCALSEPDCLDCWAVRLCDLCFYAAQEGTALTRERKRQGCRNMRERLHNALVLYVKTREKNPAAFSALAAVTGNV